MSRSRRDDGYVLFGVAVGLVILGIALTAAVPAWQKIVQREREKELIFRGYQYMQAIERYQQRFPGAFPPTVEILVEQKFLRRAYPDPFSEGGDGEFRVLRQMSPELVQAAQQDQQRAAAAAAGITDLNRSRARTSTPGGPGPRGGQFRSTLGRGASDQSLGGIVGVASSSDEKPFYQVPGKETYADWLFVYGVQSPAAVPAAVLRAGANPAAAAPSPFPGLPPPPGLTQFRFGAPGTLPAQQPFAQPGTGPPGATQPGATQPGAFPGGGAGRPGAPLPGAQTPQQPSSPPRRP